MKRALIAVVLVVAVSVGSPASAQTPGCSFVLGFAALREAVGAATIGACLEDQQGAANGDAQQHTTNGLMAWRKADNWTAFTDGYRTWVSGPGGVQQRLNTERFRWEGDAGAPGTALVAESAAGEAAAPLPLTSDGTREYPRPLPIPGVTRPPLIRTLLEQGFDCGPSPLETQRAIVACGRMVNDATYGSGGYSVTLEQNQQGRLIGISANAGMNVRAFEANVASARALFGLIATVPYAGVDPDLARRWVDAYVPVVVVAGDANGSFIGSPPPPKTTVIAGVRFYLSPGPTPSMPALFVTGAG